MGQERHESDIVLVRRTDAGVEVTPAGLIQVERLAAEGASEATIANCLGLSRRAFSDLLKDETGDERVLSAFYTGKGRLASEVVSALLQHVRNGNVTACIFACKALCNLRDQGPVPAASLGNAVQVNITIPPSMSEETFRRLAVESKEVKPNA